MICKVCTLMVMFLAVCGAFAAPEAAAQGAPTCVLVVLADPDPPAPTTSDVVDSDGSDQAEAQHAQQDCVDAEAYPGPFTDVPTAPPNPFIAPDLSAPEPPVVEQRIEETSTTTSTISSREIAHSGTETFVLAYLGTGLLAFGAFAMGIRRAGRRG